MIHHPMRRFPVQWDWVFDDSARFAATGMDTTAHLAESLKISASLVLDLQIIILLNH
jgi:hypothetical protein